MEEKIMLYPIITQSRGVMDLSGTWSFRLDDGNGFSEEWYKRPLVNSVLMAVPASYNDLKDEAAYRDHYGWVFYQKNIQLPLFMRNQRIVLRFDAVTHACIIFLNGEEICQHKGGFLPFEVEIHDLILEQNNLLTVAVDNRIDHGTLPVGSENLGGMMLIGGVGKSCETVKPQNKPNFDFFNYCGITRPVKIYTTPDIYIKDVTLRSEMADQTAIVKYYVECNQESAVQVEVLDHNGIVVSSGQGSKGEVEITQVKLWQPLKAYLYQIRVTCEQDVYTLPYGIRSVQIVGKQFLINGEPFYFKGYGKHEDTFPAGRGLNVPMNVKDISLLKWQGANSIRTSHYPYSEEMMRLCDEEGVVVIDETPAVGVHLNFGGGANFKNGKRVNTFDPIEEGGIRTFEHHKDVIVDLINRDKNYACVVMWSIANEADSAGPGAYEYFKPLFDLAKQMDPEKRPCTIVGMQVQDNLQDCMIELSDVYCLNRYYGWYVMGGDLGTAEKLMRDEMEFWESLDKPFMFTEYGADTVSGMHDTVPVMFTEEYQIEYYKMNHKVFDEHLGFIGEQVWNFADFATSQGIMRVQGNKKGIFTRERRPKMVAHYLRDRWMQIPDFNYKQS